MMSTGRRATISDVAARAGVSRSAVSFVFNGRSGLSEHTRERILEAARHFGWTPNIRAKSLAQQRAHAIGLVVRRDTVPPAGMDLLDLVSGIGTVLAREGYALIFEVVDDGRAQNESYVRLDGESRIDGVLLLDAVLDDPRPEELSERGLASVALGCGLPPASRSACVRSGGHDGLQKAVGLLTELGHRRIAYVAESAGSTDSSDRLDGWHSACFRLGAEEVRSEFVDGSDGSVIRETHRLLQLARRPTAIVYGSDAMAVVGESAAMAHGFDVPADVSIVGIGGSDEAILGSPPVTSVRLDARGAGRASASTLVALIEGRDPPSADLDGARVLVRRSTGRPMVGHSAEG